MEVLGIRYCSVTAAALIKCFAALCMPKTDCAEEGVWVRYSLLAVVGSRSGKAI